MLSMSSCIPISSSRALLCITLSTLCLLRVATSLPIQNIIVEVPNGTTNHGDPKSFCTPATWINIAGFLLFNYVAHGATVVSYPGEPASDMFLSVMAAIFFPTFGVIRAFNFIIRHPRLTGKNDLEVAARSGALCMLARSSSWKPQKGDNITNALIKYPGDEPSPQGRDTSRSDPSTSISPTYVPTYSYSRLIKLTNVFSYIKALPLCRSTCHRGSMMGRVFGLTRIRTLLRLGLGLSSVRANHLTNTGSYLSHEIRRFYGLWTPLQNHHLMFRIYPSFGLCTTSFYHRLPLRYSHHHTTWSKESQLCCSHSIRFPPCIAPSAARGSGMDL